MKKYYIQTFGCSMNQADSEKINMILLQSGFMKVGDWKDSDLIIFNTCSVRQKGEDRVFGMFQEIEKENKKRTLPDPSPALPKGEGEAKRRDNTVKKNPIIVGITGCMVRKTGMNKQYLDEEKKRESAKKIQLIDDENGIFNNDDKLFPRVKNLDFTLRIEEVKYLPQILSQVYGESIGQDYKFDDYLKQKQLRENPAQVQVIIQTGCDNYCTFCIVPYTRGKEMSRPKGEILSEIEQAVQNGAKEINLIGQNVNSYGKQFVDKKLWNEEKSSWNNKIIHPLAPSFHTKEREKKGFFKSPFRDLLDGINNIGVDRVRFTSSNPHDMTQDILDAHFDLDSTCNYLHFALQSGSNDMLKKMNRKHTYEDFKKQVDYLRKKDPLFAISTDIIVGYSGETDEMFEATLNAVRECEFDFIYNARYSVRPGTIAAKLYPDDIPDDVKAYRWHTLNNLLKQNVEKRAKPMLDREELILISGEKDHQFFGRTRNFKEVFFDKKDGINIGDLVNVKITDIDNWVLRGKIIS